MSRVLPGGERAMSWVMRLLRRLLGPPRGRHVYGAAGGSAGRARVGAPVASPVRPGPSDPARGQAPSSPGAAGKAGSSTASGKRSPVPGGEGPPAQVPASAELPRRKGVAAFGGPATSAGGPPRTVAPEGALVAPPEGPLAAPERPPGSDRVAVRLGLADGTTAEVPGALRERAAYLASGLLEALRGRRG